MQMQAVHKHLFLDFLETPRRKKGSSLLLKSIANQIIAILQQLNLKKSQIRMEINQHASCSWSIRVSAHECQYFAVHGL